MRNKINPNKRIIYGLLMISSLSIIAVLNLHCSSMFCTYKKVNDLGQLPVRLYLPFEISLEKEVYEIGEPILLFIQLKNYDDVTIEIPYLELNTGLVTQLTRNGINVPMDPFYKQHSWIESLYPLKPFECEMKILKLYETFDENLKYIDNNGYEKRIDYRFLTPGEYELNVFLPYKFSKSECQGRTEEVKVKFKVIESERGRAFLELLKNVESTRDHILRRKKILEHFDKYEGTSFASYLRYKYLTTADPYRNAEEDNYLKFVFDHSNSMWAPLVLNYVTTGANLGYNKLEMEKHGLSAHNMKDLFKQIASATRGSFLEKYINYLLSKKNFRWE